MTTDPASTVSGLERVRIGVRWLVTAAMVGIGVLHFTSTDAFVSIMPPFIPFHRAMVWISGAAEIALGLALAPEKTRRLASYGLIALFIAVFPANIYMAVAHVQPAGVTDPVPAWAAWARLPFQLVFIATAWWVGRPATREPRAKP